MGNVFDAYEFFGAHPNPDGTVFRTFAPSAERITIIGEWNDWQEENMIKDGHVWSYFSAKAKRVRCISMSSILHWAEWSTATPTVLQWSFAPILRPL